MLTYYDMLGVPRNAPEQDIKAAYRRLVKEHHPDRAKNGQGARPDDEFPTFHDVTEAYQVLKNPQTRAAYDLQLRRMKALPREREAAPRRRGGKIAVATGVALCLAVAVLSVVYGPAMLGPAQLAEPKTFDRAPEAVASASPAASEPSQADAQPESAAHGEIEVAEAPHGEPIEGAAQAEADARSEHEVAALAQTPEEHAEPAPEEDAALAAPPRAPNDSVASAAKEALEAGEPAEAPPSADTSVAPKSGPAPLEGESAADFEHDIDALNQTAPKAVEADTEEAEFKDQPAPAEEAAAPAESAVPVQDEALRWEDLQSSTSLADLAAFSERQKNTPHGRAAARRLASLIPQAVDVEELAAASHHAQSEETRTVIKARLAQVQTELAKEARRSIVWATASGLNTPEALRGFLDAYPQGPWSDEARERLRRVGRIEVSLGEPADERSAWVRPGDAAEGKFRDCALCPEMAAIPAGTLQHAKPRRWAALRDARMFATDIRISDAFAVSRSEVTAEQWQSCAEDGGCRALGRSASLSETARNAPVTGISWYDARRYAEWLSRKTGKRYRLMSEAEWEYAARAGGDEPFRWTGRPESLEARFRRQEFFGDNQLPRPSSVQATKENPWGLYNLDGNVAEWVADCWLPARHGLPPSGRPWLARDGADCTRRVLKGGAWVTSRWRKRRANRLPEFAEARDIFTGFRVARDLRPTGE